MKKFLISVVMFSVFCCMSFAKTLRVMGYNVKGNTTTFAIMDAEEKEVAPDVKAGKSDTAFLCNTKSERLKCETIFSQIEPLMDEGIFLFIYTNTIKGDFRFITHSEFKKYIRGEL